MNNERYTTGFSKTCFKKTNDKHEKTRPTNILMNIEFLPQIFQASWIKKILMIGNSSLGYNRFDREYNSEVEDQLRFRMTVG